MTREDLEELGMTDAVLEQQFKEHVGPDVSLAGEDTPTLQMRRRAAFDQVMSRATGTTSMNPKGPRMGTFAIDAPDVHKANERKP
jgi:hypothetical protein